MNPEQNQTPSTSGLSPDDHGTDSLSQGAPSNQETSSTQPQTFESTPPPTTPGFTPGGTPLGEANPNPTPSYPSPSANGGPLGGGSGARKKILMIIVALIVLTALGVGGYFGYKLLVKQNQKDTATNAVQESTSKSKTSGAIDMSTLNSLKMTVPNAALASQTLTAQQSANPTIQYYANADGSCVLLMGTSSPTFIPGNSLAEIVNAYLNTIRSAQTTVTGPNSADPRIFADATNASKKYSLPSLTFSFNQGNKQGKGYYSATILKNGDRAIVETACFTNGGPVDQSKMDGMETVAKQIVVTVE